MGTPISGSPFRTAFMLAIVAAMLQAAAMASAQADDVAALYKDLDIRQVPMVQIVSPQPSTAPDGRGLAVSATLDRPSRRYRHGDQVVLTIRTTEDAYVWILDTGTSGKVHQLFPNRYERDNFLAAGVPLSIPQADSEYVLAVSHPRGVELITVIASPENTPLTDALIDEAMSAGPFAALRGTADSVAKDLSISMRRKQSTWAADQQVLIIE